MPLEATPLHLFSTDYALRTDEGGIAVLDLSTFRSRGRFTLDGVDYEVRAEGLAGGVFTLEAAGREVARAEREGFLPLTYRLRLPDRTLTLRAVGVTRRFAIWHGDRPIGAVRPLHVFSRTALLEGAPEIPRPTQVFLLAVVLLRWRRRARASGG